MALACPAGLLGLCCQRGLPHQARLGDHRLLWPLLAPLGLLLLSALDCLAHLLAQSPQPRPRDQGSREAQSALLVLWHLANPSAQSHPYHPWVQGHPLGLVRLVCLVPLLDLLGLAGLASHRSAGCRLRLAGRSGSGR